MSEINRIKRDADRAEYIWEHASDEKLIKRICLDIAMTSVTESVEVSTWTSEKPEESGFYWVLRELDIALGSLTMRLKLDVVEVRVGEMSDDIADVIKWSTSPISDPCCTFVKWDECNKIRSILEKMNREKE